MSTSTTADNSSSSAAALTPTKQYFKGIVKQVLDGGAVVIRGKPNNGPPPERTLALADIEAPRMARRPNASGAAGTVDEPFAWEAREFLRKLLVGKPIIGTVHHTVPSGREYGSILVGSDDPETAENVSVNLVSEGLVKLRDNCNDDALKDAAATAKAQGKGIHGENVASHVRNITWESDNPRQLVDRMAGKPIQAVVEHVRDGSTVRLFLVPDFYHITLMMSGIRSPNVKPGPEGKPDSTNPDPYSLEAHYFTESRLLQREVQIVLESVNNKNYIGSVIHPAGNIAEALLREGFAKCVDWSLQCVTGGPEKYRNAQADAKQKKLRLWKDYTGPTGPQVSAKDKEFVGKVVEIVNGDAIMVKRSKHETKKIHLASIRPPRLPESRAERPKGGTFRPLYDIPFMFEAREFLRKKLIGHNVNVTVDYIQPENNDFPEKCCCTVSIGGVNVAEALVSKGLASVVRYSADNDQRSSSYDDLLAAEDKAIKSTKGMHDKKNIPTRRIADLTGDVNKSKTFLPFLQRAGKMQAVVEFVASGSRFRLFIPRETCVITFLLSGIQCPRASRTMPGGVAMEEEPFGNEAMTFVKEMSLQREVEIEVEACDKGGNFIGWLFCDNSNVSVELVDQGFAAAHVTANNSNYGRQISNAEDNAKRRKDKRWANYVEEKVMDNEEDEDKKEAEAERKVKYEKVMITEVTADGKFFAQTVEEGPKLEKLMGQIREEFSTNPPLAGSYQPKRADMCAAKFVDGLWYRAKVEKVTPTNVTVLYVDYGNRATIPKTDCGTLPASFNGLSPFAKEYSLALCLPPPDEDYAAQSIAAMKEDFLDRPVKVNVEYRMAGTMYATVVDCQTDEDLGKNLIFDGLLLCDKKGGHRLSKLVNSYIEAQNSAKKNHVNMWEYGDITADDAREFGHGK